jgi:hypothetical protein
VSAKTRCRAVRRLRLPDGTEESTVTLLLQGLDGLVRQSGTSPLECVIAGLEVDEAELEVQGRGKGLENATAGLYSTKQHSISKLACLSSLGGATHRDDLPSDTISGDETYNIPAMSVNCRATRSQAEGHCTNAKCSGSGSHFDRLFVELLPELDIRRHRSFAFCLRIRIIVDPT